jgi:hypothetical protein
MPQMKHPNLRELYSIAKSNGTRVRNLANSLGKICDDIDTFLAESTPVPRRAGTTVARTPRRRRPNGRKLTVTQIRQLRRRGAGGETFAELAEYFHCSPRTAWQAFHGHGAYRDVA